MRRRDIVIHLEERERESPFLSAERHPSYRKMIQNYFVIARASSDERKMVPFIFSAPIPQIYFFETLETNLTRVKRARRSVNAFVKAKIARLSSRVSLRSSFAGTLAQICDASGPSNAESLDALTSRHRSRAIDPASKKKRLSADLPC